MPGRWRPRAKEAVGEAYLCFADAYGHPVSPSCPEEERKAFLKILDEFYPFGERKMHPYKIWLSERRKIVDWLFPREAALGGLFEA